MAAARLEERGFDVEQLVKCVFQGLYVGEFKRLSLQVAFDLSSPASTSSGSVPPNLQAIGQTVIGFVGPPSDEDSFSVYLRRASASPELEALGKRFAGWIKVADLSDALQWDLPQDPTFSDFAEAEVSSESCDARWLADRFLLTYVHDWNTSSLHEEHRWASGRKNTSVLSELMNLRRVPQDRLNAEIADRSVNGAGVDQRSLLTTGVQHIRDGEHILAAALFQGALAMTDSAWVRNNLAFCLVPTDPAGAKAMFTELLDEGFDPPLVHANLAAVNRMLGDVSAAHGNASAGLELLQSSGSRGAYLWSFEGGAPVLAEVGLAEYLRFVLGW